MLLTFFSLQKMHSYYDARINSERDRVTFQVIRSQILDQLIIEDNIGLEFSIMELLNGIDSIHSLKIYNEKGVILAQAVQEARDGQLNIVRISKDITLQGETFGKISFEKNSVDDITHDIHALIDFLWLYAGLFLAVFLITAYSFYHFTKKVFLNAHYLSYHDPLTGLANRRMFFDYAEKERAHAYREKHELGILMIDVDNFKAFNDHYGHPQGDTCLTSIASALKNAVNRSNDIVARVGGEEFAILVSGTTLDIKCISERCSNAVKSLAIRHAPSSNNNNPTITISIGYVKFDPLPGTRIDDQLASADKALYQAKRSGRDCIVAFTSTSEKSKITAIK
ncbi:hypothetical protein A9Q81_14285 [Gammaproteobacteria bacterium 42_54_T18]|nr:hypothetical protein A9Q81_14285 [Gammaproteobacteria bacterium 42_54_T18]